LGESGSGKSTLGQILQRFYTFENGQTVLNKSLSVFLSDEDCKQVVLVLSSWKYLCEITKLFPNCPNKKKLLIFFTIDRQKSNFAGIYF